MAVVERKSAELLQEYLQEYCEPLSVAEELEIDNKAFAIAVETAPKELKLTYEALCEQIEEIRDPNDLPLPLWFFATTLLGTKASETLEPHKDLAEKVHQFTALTFGNALMQVQQEEGLVYGTWLIAPYYVVSGYITSGLYKYPRLYRLKDLANTPTEVLQSFGCEASDSKQDDESRMQVKVQGEILLPVDHSGHALARYFAGKDDPIQANEEGYRLLLTKPGRFGQKREVAVREQIRADIAAVIDPESVKPALERIKNERNEDKAKAFVGAFTLAAQAPSPEEFFVSLADFMLLIFGYRLREKTNSTDYWKKAARAIKYLVLDLSNLEVSIRIVESWKKEAQWEQEYLMHRPRLRTRHPLLFENFIPRIIELAAQAREQELIAYVKHINPVGFRLGFPKQVLDALGATRGPGERNALEGISRELIALKGPAFWLGYEIAFLRRWADPKKVAPKNGKRLLEVLEELDYTKAAATKAGGRVSYKVALRMWLQDINKLIDMGALDHPGTMLYEYKAGRWIEVSQKIEGWLKSRGVRLTKNNLEDIRVLYQIPKSREEELAKPRAHREITKRAHQRAKAANQGRAEKAKNKA